MHIYKLFFARTNKLAGWWKLSLGTIRGDAWQILEKEKHAKHEKLFLT